MIWPDDYVGKVICGDCLEVLRKMPSNCIDTIITDPPYALEFMGKEWDKVLPSVDVWHEALRIAKPGTILMAFGGTRTYHRLTCMIEDAGWQIRDCMMWLYGTGFPKSMDISKALDKKAGAKREVVGSKIGMPGYSLTDGKMGGVAMSGNVDGSLRNGQAECSITAPSTPEAQLWDGWGTALKPAWEPIVIAMKPLEGTFAQNALAHGVAGLNIDGSRIVGAPPVKPQPILHVNKVDGICHETGVGRNGSFSSALGRWPANVILDEEAGEMLDEQSGVLKSGERVIGMPRNGTSDHLIGLSQSVSTSDFSASSGGASRFFYCAKADKRERNYGLRDGTKNNHPTVKPLSLMKYLCKLTATPTGGIVLDPFAGSGSTLVGAKTIGRPYIGIEISPEYCKISEDRLRQEELF